MCKKENGANTTLGHELQYTWLKRNTELHYWTDNLFWLDALDCMFRSTNAGCIFFGTFQVRKTGPIKQPKRNMGVIQMEKTMIDHGILWNSPFRQTSIYIYMIICMYILQYQIIHITHTHIYICTDGVDKNQEPETTHNHHDPTTA